MYCSGLAFLDNCSALEIWYKANLKNAVLDVLGFLAAARDVSVGVTSLESWMGGNGCGFLVYFPSGVCREVDDIGFLRIIRGGIFDTSVSLVALPCWSEVH